MDIHHQNEQEQKLPLDEQSLQELIDGRDETTSGVPVVRANTPRPLSFARPASKSEQVATGGIYASAADFPVEAPAAPPLPEELEDSEVGAQVATASIPSAIMAGQSDASAPEFTWLFEYGLEMDNEYLNSPARLNGQARVYGPAVLKGYQIESVKLHSGQSAITLTRAPSMAQEVWGILYRIPRQLTEQDSSGHSALDEAHAALPFTATPVVAQEMYRKRAVQCITYMLVEIARNNRGSFSPVGTHFEHVYAQRLLEVARRQQLPEAYLKELAVLSGENNGGLLTPDTTRAEQNTEPLPALASSALLEQVSTGEQNMASTASGWLLALALYLVGLLMATLALAVAQTLGYWSQVFTAAFAPLGAPWYVLLYGLLGGCISCIMAIGRPARPALPGFVILTWFARPFLGVVLAALAYLILSSGLFAVSVVPAQRYAIFAVVGAIAGLCEGWLFFRRK